MGVSISQSGLSFQDPTNSILLDYSTLNVGCREIDRCHTLQMLPPQYPLSPAHTSSPVHVCPTATLACKWQVLVQLVMMMYGSYLYYAPPPAW